MFNVGGPEFLVVVLVALIVLGPQQLPKAMRTFGNVMAEVRKVWSSVRAEMRNGMDTVAETTGTEKPQSATMAKAEPAATAPAPAPAPAPASDDSDSSSESDQTEPTAAAEASTGTPPVDPADRAAG